MTIKLAISGKMKSGKDTAANYLSEKHGGTVLHIFASGYQFTSALLFYGLRGKTIDPEHKTKFERWMLQQVGSLGRKLFGKDIWLNKTIKLIDKTEGNVFITGVRFPNEIKRLKEIGVESVHITRPEDDRIKAGAFNMEHETETGLDDFQEFDYVINNDGTLRSFQIKLDSYTHRKQIDAAVSLNNKARAEGKPRPIKYEIDGYANYPTRNNATRKDWASFDKVPDLHQEVAATKPVAEEPVEKKLSEEEREEIKADIQTALNEIQSMIQSLEKAKAANQALTDEAQITAEFAEIEAKAEAKRARKRERDKASKHRRRAAALEAARSKEWAAHAKKKKKKKTKK